MEQPETGLSSTGASPKKSFDVTTALVVGGLGLIFVSVAVMVLTSWELLGPWSKTMLAAVPMLALYLLTKLYKQPAQLETNRLLFGAATLLVGVTAATALYQFKVFPEIDNNLLITASIIGWIVSAALEGVLHRSELAITSAMYATIGWLVWVGKSLDRAANPVTTWSGGLIVLGLALVASSYIWRLSSSESGGRRFGAGWVFVILGMLVFWPAITTEIFKVDSSSVFYAGLLSIPVLIGISFWRRVVPTDYFTTKQAEMGRAALELIPPILIFSIACGLIDRDLSWYGFAVAAVGYLATLLAWRWPMISAVVLGPLTVAAGLLMQVGESSAQAVAVAIIGLLIIASTVLYHVKLLNAVGLMALVVGILYTLIQLLGSSLAGPLLACVLGVILIIAGSLFGKYVDWWRSLPGHQPVVDISFHRGEGGTGLHANIGCGRSCLYLFLAYLVITGLLNMLMSSSF